MQNIVFLGAGQLAREMHGYVNDCIASGANWKIKGFLDDRTDLLNGFNFKEPIISGVEEYSPEPNDLFVCAKGEPEFKRNNCRVVETKGGRFATVVHPSAIIGANVSLEEGAFVAPFCLLTSDIRIGKNTYIGPRSWVSHDNKVSAYCQLSGNATFGGRVVLGEGVFIGLSATLLPGISVANDGFVGAGSVVIRNVEVSERVFGIPARRINAK